MKTGTLEHHVREEQGHHIVTLTGEIDLESSPQVRQILLDLVKKRENLIVDMASVAYIDSSGIATLVEAFQLTKKQGGRLTFACLNAAVIRVFTLARLDNVFSIHANIESALNADS